MNSFKWYIVVFILWQNSFVFAQIPIEYHFQNAQDSLNFYKNINPIKTTKDSFQSLQILRGYLQTLHKLFFFEASFDSIEIKNKAWHIQTHIGKHYDGVQLQKGNIPDEYLNSIGFRAHKMYNFEETVVIEKALLEQAENKGYPFTQVYLDSIYMGKNSLSAALMMRKGAFFTFDTLNMEGFARISPNFLQQYLGIKKGDIFNRSKVLQLSPRLAELPFLQERTKPTLLFKENNTALVQLLLDPKKASRWDALVGILPNTVSTGGQKFTISFNGNADFQNLLGQGERILANFENLRPQSPRLQVKTTFPYLLNTPFGFDGAFDLYKRDSQYLETQMALGMQYLLGGNDYIKLFWHQYLSNNLIINGLSIINSKKLPNTLDIATQTFGLEFFKNKLDYRFNPRRGWSLILRGSAGVRQIRKNVNILNLKDPNDATYNFSSLYDTVNLRSFQYKIETNTACYIPFFKRTTLKIGLQSAWLISPEKISLNEQFRIGGSKILRGFNEEGLFATQYAVGTLEYRLLLGRNSYLYTFIDGGYMGDITRTTRRFDTPFGFGAGITFETKVGLFGFTLAVGKEQGNPIDVRNTKTHFGYISLF